MGRVRTKGVNPQSFGEAERRKLVGIINKATLELEGDLVKASPVGVAALLKGGWSVKPATLRNPQSVITQKQGYFLPVEMGRKPGKGINQEGQTSVILWAKRVLGLSETEGKSLAFRLSEKYKKFGRRAKGFAGLANPGDTAPTNFDPENILPVEGGLIKRAFDEIDRLLT